MSKLPATLFGMPITYRQDAFNDAFDPSGITLEGKFVPALDRRCDPPKIIGRCELMPDGTLKIRLDEKASKELEAELARGGRVVGIVEAGG